MLFIECFSPFREGILESIKVIIVEQPLIILEMFLTKDLLNWKKTMIFLRLPLKFKNILAKYAKLLAYHSCKIFR